MKKLILGIILILISTSILASKKLYSWDSKTYLYNTEYAVITYRLVCIEGYEFIWLHNGQLLPRRKNVTSISGTKTAVLFDCE